MTTFGDVVKDLAIGARLSRTNEVDGSVHSGLWTGASDGSQGLLFDQSTKKLRWVTLDSESIWSNTHDTATPLVNDLLTEAASKALAAQSNRMLYDEATNSLSTFKSNAQEALANWAGNELDDESQSYTKFNEMMVEIGLEGIKETYRIEVTVTYNLTVEVEASSEKNAREIFDNDSTSYIRDNIDVDYVDDYSIDSVERA